MYWATILHLFIEKGHFCRIRWDNLIVVFQDMQLTNQIWDVIFGLVGARPFQNEQSWS